MIRELTEQDDGVEIHVQCLEEHTHHKEHFVPDGLNVDWEIVNQILSDMEWNEWAWCTVKVWATWQDIAGKPEYLGACSYESKEDFMKPGDYFDDMKAAALKSLNKAVRGLHGKMEALRVTD